MFQKTEFQRIARRDKKAFYGQCKQMEEDTRRGKTRDLFKKIRNVKGTFHPKMGTIKDRNSKDLIEAKRPRRWKEYPEELYKKFLKDFDNHSGVVIHLELDILECEVKWTLGSNKCQ